MAELLDQGSLAAALAQAQQHRDPRIRSGFNRLRRFLEDPPLERPPFDPVMDPATGECELRESLNEEQDIPLDLAGLGVVQLYSVLAHALLCDTHCVAIEEPEAHLHAPTTGRQLRTLLQRLVGTGPLDQLFIATHSNLFDLDPSGFYEVRRLPSGTTVERHDDLTRIDLEHLCEPGPTKHALLRMMKHVLPR